MSFAINPSLNYIDISERYVVEMYRSRTEIVLSDARFRGHPCEAYICISRVEKTVKAYVALLEMGMKSVFVYTSDYSTENSADFPGIFAEAEEFLTSLGFSMEKVNLEFSPAMREVIIKGFRVMRPPPKRAVLRTVISLPAEQVSISAAPLYSAEKSLPLLTGAEALPAEIKSLQAELSSAKTVIEKISREKLALAQSASREIDILKSSVEKITAAKEILEQELGKEIEALKEESLANVSRKNDDLITDLKEELDSTKRKAEAAEKAFAADISALNAKLESIECEKDKLEFELSELKRSSAEEILKLSNENEYLSGLLAAEKLASSERVSALVLHERSSKESRQREEDLCRELETMKEQISLLEADLGKYNLREEVEAVRLARIADLEKELEQSKTAVEQLDRKIDDCYALELELKNMTEAKNDVEAEYIRMANETMGKENELLEALYDADARIISLSKELELQCQVAAMEKTALLNEIKQMALSTASSLPRVETLTLTGVESADRSAPDTAKEGGLDVLPLETESYLQLSATGGAETAASDPVIESGSDVVVEDETDDGPVIGDPEITGGLTNEFGGFYGSSGQTLTEFRIDPDMNVIEYSDPAEVVAILYASNNVQAVLDASGVHRCKGYIVTIKKEGSYRVYLLWHLLESGKIRVCIPQQQPADSAECIQILQDAITYFEIVGFMMEMEDLGHTLKSYKKAIMKVPALSRK